MGQLILALLCIALLVVKMRFLPYKGRVYYYIEKPDNPFEEPVFKKALTVLEIKGGWCRCRVDYNDYQSSKIEVKDSIILAAAYRRRPLHQVPMRLKEKMFAPFDPK